MPRLMVCAHTSKNMMKKQSNLITYRKTLKLSCFVRISSANAASLDVNTLDINILYFLCGDNCQTRSKDIFS